MPCTNANCEVMMQYYDWDIIIILTLDDTLPLFLGNAVIVIFVTASHYVLLFAVECAGVN